MPEIMAEFPKDVRLKWGVSPSDYDPKKQTFELYAIRSTQRDGRAPLEGDVISSASDDYDQYGKPCVNKLVSGIPFFCHGIEKRVPTVRRCAKPKPLYHCL